MSVREAYNSILDKGKEDKGGGGTAQQFVSVTNRDGNPWRMRSFPTDGVHIIKIKIRISSLSRRHKALVAVEKGERLWLYSGSRLGYRYIATDMTQRTNEANKLHFFPTLLLAIYSATKLK